MRHFAGAAIWLMLCVAVALAAVPRADALQGSWTAIEAQRDGRPADDLVGHRLTLKGNRFEIASAAGARLFAGTVVIDDSAKPAAIDFAHDHGPLTGKVWKGIYAIEGDALTICDNAPDPGKDRPAEFRTEGGSGYVLLTFVRDAPLTSVSISIVAGARTCAKVDLVAVHEGNACMTSVSAARFASWRRPRRSSCSASLSMPASRSRGFSPPARGPELAGA